MQPSFCIISFNNECFLFIVLSSSLLSCFAHLRSPLISILLLLPRKFWSIEAIDSLNGFESIDCICSFDFCLRPDFFGDSIYSVCIISSSRLWFYFNSSICCNNCPAKSWSSLFLFITKSYLFLSSFKFFSSFDILFWFLSFNSWSY